MLGNSADFWTTPPETQILWSGRGAQESASPLKLTRVSQMHRQDWEPLVWQVLENLIFPKAPASHKGRFSAQPSPHPHSSSRVRGGWSRRSDSDATRRGAEWAADWWTSVREPGPRGRPQLSSRDGGRAGSAPRAWGPESRSLSRRQE